MTHPNPNDDMSSNIIIGATPGHWSNDARGNVKAHRKCHLLFGAAMKMNAHMKYDMKFNRFYYSVFGIRSYIYWYIPFAIENKLYLLLQCYLAIKSI